MYLLKFEKLIEKKFRKFGNFSQLLLRLGLGIAFIFHGISKFPLPPQKLIEYFGFNSMLASLVAISELIAGVILIVSGFIKTFIGSLLTRLSALIIVVIMICAFYFAHQDWFFNSKLFTSEQIFLFLIGIFFLINGNRNF